MSCVLCLSGIKELALMWDDSSAQLCSQGKYHKCPQPGCFLVFKHAMGKKMLTHLEEIHQVDGKKLELGRLSTVCSYCAKIFNTAFALRRHLQNTHEAPMVSFQRRGDLEKS